LPTIPTPKSLTPLLAPLSISELASELVSVLAYKTLIFCSELADSSHLEVSEEVEDLLSTLLNNLRGRLRTVPTSGLAKVLDPLPTSQLGCLVSILLADQSGVQDPSGERLQIITSFTSKLASLLPDEDLPPEASEYIDQLVYRPGTKELPLEERTEIILSMVSMLGYKLNY
jgi:hypothetical protein